MATTNRPRIVRCGNMISLRGQEFSIVIFKALSKSDGDTIYGLKPQTCRFLRAANRFQYEDVFRSAVWLSSRELNCLIAELMAFASPSELKSIIERLEALANDLST